MEVTKLRVATSKFTGGYKPASTWPPSKSLEVTNLQVGPSISMEITKLRVAPSKSMEVTKVTLQNSGNFEDEDFFCQNDCLYLEIL